MDDNLTTWLNTQLTDRGWSHRELARRAKISQTAVSTVLSDQRNPGWDFCASIARALGESPETIMRLAGLLPPIPKNVKEETEALNLFRSLPDDLRIIAVNVLRVLQNQYSPEIVMEASAPYRVTSTPQSNLDVEIMAFLEEYPELREIIDEAQEQLSETAIRALILNIRIFASETNERKEFTELHRQLSDVFTGYTG